MARSKKLPEGALVEAAKQTFWETGFERTAISDLERSTGLYRSSLYHAYGTKRGLFAAALRRYVTDFVDPRLQMMEEDPGLAAIDQFFSRLGSYFRGDTRTARRGCLIVNALADLPSTLDEAALTAAGLPARLQHAFAGCLRAAARSKQLQADTVPRRAGLLATATLGIWLSARVDPRVAARRCAEIREEVASWQNSG